MRMRGSAIAAGLGCLALLVPAGASARTYTVNKTADPGPAKCEFKKKRLKKNKCSLRSAITAANANPGRDTIRFKIGKGMKSITPTSSLPDVTDRVTIDGWSQKGFKSKPLIEIDGQAFAPQFGLSITQGADDSVVRGLILNGNSENGIRLFQVSGVDVLGCWIGIQPNGSTPAPVGFSGVLLDNAPSATIGGSSAMERNVISGNGGDGITGTSGAASTPVTIAGNRIGTNAAGNAAVGNGGAGIDLNNAPGPITIGSPAAANLISGNTGDGVQLQDIDEFSGAVTMQNNMIGLAANGEDDLGNGGDGVQHSNPRANHIGGSTAAARNVISGNGGAGIRLQGAYNDAFGAPDTWIRGNYIGTDATGRDGLGNTTHGVMLSSASDAVEIGGAAAGEGNVIAGSDDDGYGVRVSGSGGTAILGNKIGVNKNDQADSDLSNSVGVELAGASFQFVGANSDSTPAPNVIGNNESYGLRIQGGTGQHVSGNFIGTPNAAADIGNGTDASTDAGILVTGGGEAVIGETLSGAFSPNLIGFNNGDGIRVDDGYAEITRNPIFLNDGLGINLVGGIESTPGVTTNDDDDPDTGPNFLMNHPQVTGVVPSGNGANYTVSLDAKPNTTYRIEVFAAPAGGCDASGYGEGNIFLLSGTITTNASGVGSNTFFRNGGIGPGTIVMATASYDEFIGSGLDSTSEFGPCFTVP